MEGREGMVLSWLQCLESQAGCACCSPCWEGLFQESPVVAVAAAALRDWVDIECYEH